MRAGGAVGALVVSACLLVPAQSGGLVASATATSTSLPQCAVGDHPVHRLRPGRLKGPAERDQTNHVVTSEWSVDHHKLRVAPPPAGATAAIGIRQAARNLLAALTPNNFSIADTLNAGEQLELADVTVSSRTRTGYNYSVSSGSERDRPAVYRRRLAWVLVTAFSPPTSCPSTGGTARKRPAANRRSFGYQVYALDAQSGGSPLIYTESGPEPCGFQGWVAARVSVPHEQISMPWTLDSVARDRESAELTASYSTCGSDSVQDEANVGRPKPVVELIQERDYVPVCAPSTERVELAPATIYRRIPKHLIHARVGPVDWPN
jgi:hypothetical protein